MKKITLLLTTIVFVLTFGLAFAEESTSKEMSGRLYNGITFFETGSTPACGDAARRDAGEAGAKLKMSNGITYFDLGLPGSGARGSCAGGSAAKGPSTWPKNGITIFS